jgi:hypothetical protein
MSNVLPPYTSNYAPEAPNVVNSMLNNVTEYTEAQAARRGKFSITGESIITHDVPHSEVAADWESRINKATTKYRPRKDIPTIE